MHVTPGLLPGGGVISGAVQVKNASGTIINPATEETLESVAGFSIPAYDYIKATYPDAVTEVYTFKTGGSGGVTVGVLTVVYTTSSKAFIDTVTRT